jgi:hypothetical protein
LPCVYDPAADKRQWYAQLMFAQHAANLAPVWPETEPEEKAEQFQLMREMGLSELDAAIEVARQIDRARGIEPIEPIEPAG